MIVELLFLEMFVNNYEFVDNIWYCVEGGGLIDIFCLLCNFDVSELDYGFLSKRVL